MPSSQASPSTPEATTHDVRAAHGEQVVEAGGAEALLERVRETAVLAEHDSLDHAAAFSREPGRAVAREPGVQPVGDAAEPAAPADPAPGVGAQHDVHAVAAQPGSLVEAVRRPARRTQHAEHRQARALRRRPAVGQLEQHRLAQALARPSE